MVIEAFNNSTEILRASRNTLKVISFEGVACVVKAFKKPSFPQNYTYGLFSDSKAKKSYNNAKTILEKGFSTPKPIGYFEKRNAGKLIESYYLCEYAREAVTLQEIYTSSKTLPEQFIEKFATFCAELHVQGVLHRDFNLLNILVTDADRNPSFALVDINRITWYNSLTLKQAMRSMSRIRFKPHLEERFLTKYAKYRDLDPTLCQALLKREKLKTKRYFQNKKNLRKIFPKK